MVFAELRTRLQTLWSQSSAAAAAAASSRISSTQQTANRAGGGGGGYPFRRRRRPIITAGHSQHGPYGSVRATTGLDIARFGLLSIATLPFTSWLALFTYDYYYRVELCQDSFFETEDDFDYSSHSNNNNKKAPNAKNTMIGREAQLEEVRALLSNPRRPPHQILVVAGPNESGKSRFVSSLLQTIDPQTQGVTYIQLSQSMIVDSLSALTQAIVKGFHLRWLQLRYALVDVLPFAGSEILVMKERYSDRDLAQALEVVTEALQQNAKQQQLKQKRHALLPVIVIDGLGEGGRWFRSPEGRQALQQILKWCITITKERGLAHVILTGNEELVISLTDQNRTTRGHVQVIGLSTLDAAQAGPSIVRQEWPDATSAEIQKLTDTFGGFIHDLHAASRQIQQKLTNDTAVSSSNNTYKKGRKQSSSGGLEEEQQQQQQQRRAQIVDQVLSARFRLQVERVTAAFAKGKDESTVDEEAFDEVDDDDDGMDPYLDPLKRIYSEAQAKKSDNASLSASPVASRRPTATWSQLQLWRTLQRLVESSSKNTGGNMAVPFGDLRDEIFVGDMTPLLELMNEDVLGFEVGGSTSEGDFDPSSDSVSWSWQIKPATPALGRVFQYLVQNGHLKERFEEMERIAEQREKLTLNEQQRRQLRQESRRLDRRKASLLKTTELGSALEMEKESLFRNMGEIYQGIVSEEIAIEKRGRELRAERRMLLQSVAASSAATAIQHGQENKENKELLRRTETTLVPPPSAFDNGSIQKHLKEAILETCEQEGDRAFKVRESFQRHAQSEAGGVTAADVVRLIKESTGEDIALEVAETFVSEWDANKDDRLDYDEFIEMILADATSSSMQKKKKKKKKTG